MQEITTFLSNNAVLSFAIAIVIVLLVIVELLRMKRGGTRLTPAQATHLINREHAVVVDTRPGDHYKKGHIIDAVSLSVTDIRDNSKKIEKLKSKPLIFVCATGVESQKLAALLLKRGYNAYTLSGGMRAWSDAGMPLVKE